MAMKHNTGWRTFGGALGVAALALLGACGGGGGANPLAQGMSAGSPNAAASTGQLSGKVQDASGQALAGVTLTLFHHNLNTSVSTVSDGGGNYSFSGLDASAISDFAVYAQSDQYGFAASAADSAAQVTRFDFMGLYRSVVRLHPMPARQVNGVNFVGYRAGEQRVQLAQTGPGQRLRDNLNGTVSDLLTGLLWLKDAGCLPASDWAGALAGIQALAEGSCALSDGSKAGQWRMPNVNELESLVDIGHVMPALPAGHPFARIRMDVAYWSSTTYTAAPGSAMAIRMLDGRWINSAEGTAVGFQNGKTDARNGVWAVRTDSVPGRVSLMATGAYAGVGGGSFGVGDDAALATGVSLSSPRFVDRGDGTVADTMTGLTWLKQADCIRQNWIGALSSVGTLADGQCGLHDGSLAGQWRLPNRTEMLSLSDRAPTFPQAAYFNGQYQNSATVTGPAVFRNFIVFDYYWTSSSTAADPAQAWSVYSCDFGVYNLGKTEQRYALAVR